MNLSFSNKSSAVPQFLCFQQQEGMPKDGVDSFVSSQLFNVPATSVFQSGHKSQRTGVVQKEHVTGNDRKHARVRYSANQLEKDTVSTTLQRKSVTPYFDTAAVSEGSVVGSTDSNRNTTKITKDPQLTIFYNGSVFVYDRVSPDKARAILLLAGNDSLAACSISAHAVPVHESPNIGGLVASQPYGISIKKLRTMPRDPVSKNGNGLAVGQPYGISTKKLHTMPRDPESKNGNGLAVSQPNGDASRILTATARVSKNGDIMVVRRPYGTSSSHVPTRPSNVQHHTATARVSTNGDSLVVSQPYGTSSSHVSTIPSNVAFSFTQSRNSNAGKGATACLSRISRISGSMSCTVGRSGDEGKRARRKPSPIQRKTASTLDSVMVSVNDDDAERPVGILESSWNVPGTPSPASLIQSVPATSKPSGSTVPQFYRSSLEDFRYTSKKA